VQLHDAALPAARHLLGGRARELLAVAVGAGGGRLRRFTSEQALYRPGHDLVVRYDALVDWGDGRPVGVTLVASTALDGAPPGTMVLQAEDLDGGLEVAVWRYPFDPDLTGLADAVIPSRAAELVGDFVGDLPTLEVRTFRPRRRAVVEAIGPAGRVFLKVVPPAEVARLVAAHEALAGAGLPVPQVLRAEPDRGLVALSAIEGGTLRQALAERSNGIPAEHVTALLDGLRATRWVDAPPAEPGTLVHAAGHGLMLQQVLPSERDRVQRLLDELEGAGQGTEEPRAVVHGDLHEAQVLVRDDGSISGLIDLDDAGYGHPADDAANLVAHLLSFGLGRTAPVRRRIEAVVGAVLRRAAEHTEPVDLDRRVAAGLIAMATGPFRAHQPGWRQATSARLALAEQRLAAHGSPQPLRERPLSRAS
jgi:hypothetical protein